MAEWKKVIVSGSAAELAKLNVEPNQQISGSASDTFLSGSFSGSFQGDGSGLTNITASTAISASYATSASYADSALSASYALSASHADSATSSSYADSALSASYATSASHADSATSASYADSALSASYATSASYSDTALSASYADSALSASYATSASYADSALSASYSETANSSSYALSSSYADTALSASYAPDTTFPYTGSAEITGSLSVTGSTNLYNSGSNVFTVSGSLGELFSITDDNTGDLLTIYSASIPFFTVNSNQSLTLTGSAYITGSLEVVGGVTGSSFTGSFVGDGSQLTGITASLLLSSASNGSGISTFTFDGSSNVTVEVSGAAALSSNAITKWTGDAFANSTITDDGSLVTFSTGALFQGDITVQGTASFQNTENLLVADRFVLFASGSNTVGDGGIIVQQGTQNIGELYGYDSGVQRWGFTGSFDASSTSYAPEAYIAAVVDVDGGQSDIAKYQNNGNIRVSGSDIYIYA
jgi:hypothetical protein